MAKMNMDLSGGSGTPAGLKSAVPAGGGLSSRTFPRAGSGGGLPKVITAVLVEDELYKTDGSNTTYVIDIFDLPQIRTLGPMIVQIRVHYVCEGATANFQAKVSTGWSVLGKSWSTSVDLLAAQTGAQTGVISAWYANDANFGLLTRYAIEVKNSSGVAIESGRLTVVLEIVLKS